MLSYYNAAPPEGRLVSSLFSFLFHERRTGVNTALEDTVRLHCPWVHNQNNHGWYCAGDRVAFTLLWLFLFLRLATFSPKLPRFLLVLYVDLIIINETHGRKEKQIC